MSSASAVRSISHWPRPHSMGPRPVGDQPGLRRRGRHGRPAHDLQARREGRRRGGGHVGDVHAEAQHRRGGVHVPPLRDGAGHPFFYYYTDDHVSTTMLHVIVGVLEHAAPLMAWYAPTINSYRRTNSSEFAGHGVTWGYDNRTVSCRVLGTGPTSMRLEWRPPGARCDPVPRGRRRHRIGTSRCRRPARPRPAADGRRLPAGGPPVPAAPGSGSRGVPGERLRRAGCSALPSPSSTG